MTSGSANATATVSPHRRSPDKPEPWADRTALSVSQDKLVVRDLRNRTYSYPLATGPHKAPQAVASLVITRTHNADKASEGIEEQLELVTRDNTTVCVLPGWGWQREELQDFARVAGLGFKVDTLKNYGDLHRRYPRVKGAPQLPLYTRKGTLLLMLGLVGLIVIVGAVLLVIAL